MTAIERIEALEALVKAQAARIDSLEQQLGLARRRPTTPPHIPTDLKTDPSLLERIQREMERKRLEPKAPNRYPWMAGDNVTLGYAQ